VIRRIAGVVSRPRATMAELVAQPTWVATWLVILIGWGICAVAFLSTAIGRQALIDEQVRISESFGATITDAEYAALLTQPPWWVYFTNGGRLLMTPIATVLTAVAVWIVGQWNGGGARWSQALSIVVHATVVLLIGQLITAPLHYVRESLTSPLNLAAVLPAMDEGTVLAQFFGSLDFFVLWWCGLLAIGLATLTRRTVGRYALALAGLYMGFAAVITATIAVMGGS
jgi:hypothetical protein